MVPASDRLLAFTAQDWNAVGQMLLGLSAVVGGGWALYNFRRPRRHEAAQWLHKVFADFYLSETFRDMRQLLEYDYARRAGDLLEQRLIDRDIVISQEEMSMLLDLDTLLNYFEFLLYLEEEHQLARNDRVALFAYWFDVLRSPEHAGLRMYVARWGFERIVRVLGIGVDELVVICGGLDERDALRAGMESLGRCRVRGTLYEVDGVPALVLGPGSVVAELFLVTEPWTLEVLDARMRCDLRDSSSLFVRRAMQLTAPRVDAWVYAYAGSLARARTLPSEHRGERDLGR